jgi:hypothetical protein
MKRTNRINSAFAGIGTAVLLASGSVFAGGSGKAVADKDPVEEEPWAYCDVFDLLKLYEDDGNPCIDSFAIIGRYHGQYHYVDGNQGKDDGWDNRRTRIGTKIGFLSMFTFDMQFNLDVDGGGRFFEDIEEATIKFKPWKNGTIKLGKQKAAITREWSTSSRKIKTIERSQLVNQVVSDKIYGVTLKQKVNDKLWAEGGIYCGSYDEDWETPEFNGSAVGSVRIGYNVTGQSEVRLDYTYTDGAGVDNGVNDYDHLVSLNSESQWDKLGLVTDLIFGSGIDDSNHSDVFGIVVMPNYKVTDKLEGILRYTFSTSDSDNGIRLQKRYERPSASSNQYGDTYNAIYAGLNYYLCGDNLKLMTGVEYSDLKAPKGDDWKGWSVFTGVRLYF